MTQQKTKSHDAPDKDSLSQFITSDEFLYNFLSYQLHYANCYQSGSYIRWSLCTCSKVQKQKNVIPITWIFFSCLKGVISAFQSLNKHKSKQTHKKVRGNKWNICMYVCLRLSTLELCITLNTHKLPPSKISLSWVKLPAKCRRRAKPAARSRASTRN